MHALHNRLWRLGSVLFAGGVVLAVLADATALQAGSMPRQTSEPSAITVADAELSANIAAATATSTAAAIPAATASATAAWSATDTAVPFVTQAVPMEPRPSSEPEGPVVAAVSVISNVYYTQPVSCGGSTCQVALDIYVPDGPGPYPTVVLVRGGPSGLGGRVGLGAIASQLASDGLIVYNADYRDLASGGGGYPQAFQDVACAIRYARATAPGYGGDGIVTLVGHSFGGFVGSVVALDSAEFTGGCLQAGIGRPDAFVGLAGNYDLNYNLSDLAEFFGAGTAQSTARASSNPFNYGTQSPIPVRLIAGTSDNTVDPEDSVELNAFLQAEGWDVSLDLVPGGSHMSILDGAAGGAVFASILSASSAGAARAAGPDGPAFSRVGP
jgi:acetyl esterase/lipase